MTEETVRRAFVEAVRRNHPDSGDGAIPLSEIKKARDLLLRRIEHEATLTQCPRCGGEGRVRSGLGQTKCAACRGEGVVKK